MSTQHLPDSLPGIEIAEAVQRIGGRQQLLLELLKEFANDNADAAQRIAVLIEAQSTSDAIRMAHSVKGVAASCGCNRVARAAQAVEDDLKQGPPRDFEANLEELAAALGEMTESVATLSQPDPAADTISGHNDEAVDIDLEYFLHRLRRNDFTVAGDFDAHKSALAQRYSDVDMSALADAMRRYDYARARILLEGGDKDDNRQPPAGGG